MLDDGKARQPGGEGARDAVRDPGVEGGEAAGQGHVGASLADSGEAGLTGGVDPERYLDRIGAPAAGGPPALDALATLQAAHLVTVPFENLDVYHRRGVSTDVAASYAKVVEARRGGWCFELNGLFGWLLGRLGYEVDRVSCQVWGPDGWGPPFDHLGLVVHLDGERWLVDVGFGDCCLSPIRLTSAETDALPRPVRCAVDGDGFVTCERQPDGTWVEQLRGSFTPRALADFEPRSRYLQTAPGLPWTEKPFATRALDATGSRVTLRRHILRTRAGTGEFVDRPVATDEWSARAGGALRPRRRARPLIRFCPGDRPDRADRRGQNRRAGQSAPAERRTTPSRADPALEGKDIPCPECHDGHCSRRRREPPRWPRCR